MKIVVALDSFKGSLSAKEACEAVAKGLSQTQNELDIRCMPISDGGDGLLDAVHDECVTSGFREERVTVSGPYGHLTSVMLLNKGKTALIEMAQASGLELVSKAERRTLFASTYGLGQAIDHALHCGCQTFWIGLGGSATNDMGLGAMQALGCRFFDRDGQLINAPFKACDLIRLDHIESTELQDRLGSTSFIGVADVNNPLLGENGATRVFGPQKGADATDLDALEMGMRHAAAVLAKHFKEDVSDRPGAGAAGGLGAGLMWFMNASIKGGADTVLNLLKFDEALEGADWVITGEGRFDAQSLSGKAPLGVIERAKRKKISVCVFCGESLLSKEESLAMGIAKIGQVIEKARDRDDAMRNARHYLSELARAFFATK